MSDDQDIVMKRRISITTDLTSFLVYIEVDSQNFWNQLSRHVKIDKKIES